MVKGRLEFFRKFIQIRDTSHPSAVREVSVWCVYSRITKQGSQDKQVPRLMCGLCTRVGPKLSNQHITTDPTGSAHEKAKGKV